MSTTVRSVAATRMNEDRLFVATIYMGPKTYYSLDIRAGDMVEAAREAVGACLEANPFWRVVRLSEISKIADEAPLALGVE